MVWGMRSIKRSIKLSQNSSLADDDDEEEDDDDDDNDDDDDDSFEEAIVGLRAGAPVGPR